MKTRFLKSLIVMASLAVLAGCNSGKELQGFDIDLARETASLLGVKVKFQEIVWDNKEIELNSKNIDLIWNGLTITDQRSAAMEISLPYMANKQVVVAPKSFNSTITSSSKYKIAFEQGSAGNDVFEDNDLFNGSTAVALTGQIDALTEVKSGTSDLAIIDSVMAGYYLKDDTSFATSLKILTDYNLGDENYGIAARKGEKALIAKINESLDTLYNNGKINEIANKYGLTNDIIKPGTYTSFSSITDDESWNYITKKGVLTIGYTIYAPIAFNV